MSFDAWEFSYEIFIGHFVCTLVRQGESTEFSYHYWSEVKYIVEVGL